MRKLVFVFLGKAALARGALWGLLKAIFRAMCDEARETLIKLHTFATGTIRCLETQVGEQTDCHEHHERCSGFEKMPAGLT